MRKEDRIIVATIVVAVLGAVIFVLGVLNG